MFLYYGLVSEISIIKWTQFWKSWQLILTEYYSLVSQAARCALDTLWYVLQSLTPRMFLSLDRLSKCRIQHGAIGSLYVTSSYSTWIFCRWVSGFATDCPCGVWCRVLTTCLLHIGPPSGNRFLKQQLGCRCDIMDGISYFVLYFDICLDTSYHFLALSLLLKYSFFKYSCTNIFHRRSLYTFYSNIM